MNKQKIQERSWKFYLFIFVFALVLSLSIGIIVKTLGNKDQCNSGDARCSKDPRVIDAVQEFDEEMIKQEKIVKCEVWSNEAYPSARIESCNLNFFKNEQDVCTCELKSNCLRWVETNHTITCVEKSKTGSYVSFRVKSWS